MAWGAKCSRATIKAVFNLSGKMSRKLQYFMQYVSSRLFPDKSLNWNEIFGSKMFSPLFSSFARFVCEFEYRSIFFRLSFFNFLSSQSAHDYERNYSPLTIWFNEFYSDGWILRKLFDLSFIHLAFRRTQYGWALIIGWFNWISSLHEKKP